MIHQTSESATLPPYVFLLALLLALGCHVSLAADELQRIPIPTPDAVAAEEAFPAHEIEGWMDEVVLATESRDVDFSAVCEMSFSGSKGHGLGVVGLRSINFRWAENREDAAKRVIVESQDLMANEAIAFDEGEAHDTLRRLDFLWKENKVWVSSGSESIHLNEFGALAGFRRVVPNSIDDWTAANVMRLQRVFHPCRASVTGFAQTWAGYSMSIEDHSVLRSTIRGSFNDGMYTHVLLRIGTDQLGSNQMVTFRDKLPVQLESWEEVDPKTKKALSFAVTRTAWKEIEKGIFLPVRLHAVRQHRRHPGELRAEITWRVGRNVDKSLFELSTMGHHVVSPQSAGKESGNGEN